MSDNTAIEWCDASLALVTGCSPAGVGCAHCYARRMWPRLQKMAAPKYGGREFCEVRFHPEELERPRSWKRPRAIFISPMGDLFHEAVPQTDLLKVIGMWESCRRHTIVVLTKRALSMRHFFANYMPPPNVVLGVSCSTQEEVNELVPHLLSTHAQRRVVSLEPLVGPVIVPREYLFALDGVIVGGETGPGARPMHPDWVRSLRDQCAASGVPFFFKQWGEWVAGCQTDVRNLPSNSVLMSAIGDTGRAAVSFSGDGDDCVRLFRVGRSRAGRLLDGRTHDELCWDVRGKGEV